MRQKINCEPVTKCTGSQIRRNTGDHGSSCSMQRGAKHGDRSRDTLKQQTVFYGFLCLDRHDTNSDDR